MTQIVSLTLAGEPLAGGQYGPRSWDRPLGGNAPTILWCVPNDVADKVLKLTETEASIQVAGMPAPKVIKRVKVVREQKSDDPLRRYLILSDTRWYLSGTYVKANYNLRVESAQTELLKVDGSPLEVDPVADVITYAGSSLRNGVPWTADEILDDVMDRINEQLAELNVSIALVRTTTRGFGNYVPPDVQLDGPGNISLMHALGAVGGVDIRVNDNGDFELVDAMMGAERRDIETLIPYSLQRMGQIKWITQPNVQPVSVKIGFDAEMEVRADGWLDVPGSGYPDPGHWPTLDNVVKVTDLQLVTNDLFTRKQSLAVSGSFLHVDEWFSAVLHDTVVPAPPVPPQVTWSRQYACIDYMRGLMEHWYVTGELGGLEPSSVWMARYASYREHFLKTWRLNPAFARLCLPGSIRPVRAQLLNAANQSRQPAFAAHDWCRRVSIRGTRDDPQLGWNKHGVPGTPTSQKVGFAKVYDDPSFPTKVLDLTKCTQSPTVVALRDPIAGIFQLATKKDIHDFATEVVPALVQQLPINDLDQVIRGAGPAYWEDAQLVQTHRLVLVFSATPATSPLYEVDVSPLAALQRLRVENVTVAPRRPPMHLRVGPALQTARFAYFDNIRKTIQDIFDAQSHSSAKELLQSLTPVNFDILTDYAQAAAGTLWAALLDHYEGDAEIEFTPDAMPIGSLVNVSHIIKEDGSVYTRFDCQPVQPALQPIHLMERGARAVIFRMPAAGN